MFRTLYYRINKSIPVSSSKLSTNDIECKSITCTNICFERPREKHQTNSYTPPPLRTCLLLCLFPSPPRPPPPLQLSPHPPTRRRRAVVKTRIYGNNMGNDSCGADRSPWERKICTQPPSTRRTTRHVGGGGEGDCWNIMTRLSRTPSNP